MTRDLVAALEPLVSRVRTDVSWVKTPSGDQFLTKEPLTDERLAKHLNGGPARGVAPMLPGEAVTRVALLDLDSHKGETTWPDMQAAGRQITKALVKAGGEAVAFRSSGGRGIHLYLLWGEPQDAYSVRRWLKDVLASAGFESGSAGVKQGQVEIFPKRDAVAEGRYGNQFILPLAGASVPLDPSGLEELPRDEVTRMAWPLSAPVPLAARPVREPRVAADTPKLSAIRAALAAIPDGSDPLERYDPWLAIVHAVHSATNGSEEGRAAVHEFSQRSTTYDADELDDKWERAEVREDGITVGTLFKTARELGGWQEPIEDDFEVIEDAAPAAGLIDRVDFASLMHTLPPDREWVLDQYIPRGAATALFGRGGEGKSLIAQQLAFCVANGTPFAGRAVRQGNVLGLFAEDDNDEMLRRGAAIYAALDLQVGSGADKLDLQARAGRPNALISFGADHAPRRAPLMNALFDRARELQPSLIILDNIAQLFAGTENDRHEVTAFCNEITGLARELNCAVLLLGHVAKSDGSEYSGSTAWENAVRSRLLLARQADGSTLLRKLKANYSQLDEVRLEWRAGAFAVLPTAAEAGPEAIEGAKPLVLRALGILTARKQAASHLKTARNYLIRLMCDEPDLQQSVRPELLQAALNALLDAGEVLPAVDLPWKNSSRHAVQGLASP